MASCVGASGYPEQRTPPWIPHAQGEPEKDNQCGIAWRGKSEMRNKKMESQAY